MIFLHGNLRITRQFYNFEQIIQMIESEVIMVQLIVKFWITRLQKIAELEVNN